MPLVSIIVPNFNHSSFLERRIDSILSQTFRDFELIILDDCSTDDSRQIIEKYRGSEKVSHIIFNEKNSGSTFIQWDKGINIAQGEYIWVAESDDFCEPVFLEELITPLLRNRSISIAFCQSLFVSPEGKILNRSEADELVSIIPGKEYLKRYLLGTNPISNVSMTVFRKDVFRLASSEYKTLKYCGDWLLYANLCLHGDVFISGKYLNYFLRHKNSVTYDAMKQGLDFLEGNLVFHFIRKNVLLTQSDISNALIIKITDYSHMRNEFTREVRQKVLKSLMELDPVMRTLIIKRKYKQLIRGFLAGIRRSLS